MKKHYDRKPSWVRGKKRPTIPESQPQLDRLRTLSQWLLIFPVVMLLLFSCGQIGIITSRKIAESNIQSNITADYGPWSYVLIHSVKPEIIEDIFRDRQNEDGENGTVPEQDQSDTPWLNTIPQPTSVAHLEPTSTFIPSPSEENQPPPTETGIPQITPTQTPQTSSTPIPTQSEPTITSSPIPTSNPTNTPSPTDLPTNTPVVTISNTYWFSNDRVLNGYALTPNQPTGPALEESGYTRFYTEPFPDGTTIKGGRCTLTFYASNNTDQNWEIGIVISAGNSRWRTLGGTTKTIPANTTTPTLFTNNLSILSHTFTQGERLSIAFSLTPFITMHWDGEWNDAGLVVPLITP
jgi:hypothetical protein